MHSTALALRLPSREHPDMMSALGSSDRIVESIESSLRSLNPNEVILWVAAFMVLFTVIDGVTFFFGKFLKSPHRDLKTSIVSLGILGTFIGITIGLAQFDPEDDVRGGISELLRGLRVAFYTSVWGMFLSIVLAFLQRIAKANAGRDNADKIDEIIDLINKGSKANQGELKSLNTNVKTLRNDLKAHRRRTAFVSKSLVRVERDLAHRLNDINCNLEQALNRIAQTASREIVEVLRDVVRKFNDNIQEQFGKSLRQLSDACENLLMWQDKHKETVDELYRQLQCVATVTERATVVLDSSAKETRAVLKMCEQIGTVVSALDGQMKTTTDHLGEYASAGKEVKEALMAVTKGIDDAQGKIVNMTTVSQTIFNEQVELQKRTLASMGETAKRIEVFNSQVAAHAEKTRGELKAQAQQVARTMEDMTEDLAKALKEMQDVFVRVTEHLADSYEKHLDYLREKVKVLSECLREMQQTLRKMEEKSNE